MGKHYTGKNFQSFIGIKNIFMLLYLTLFSIWSFYPERNTQYIPFSDVPWNTNSNVTFALELLKLHYQHRRPLSARAWSPLLAVSPASASHTEFWAQWLLTECTDFMTIRLHVFIWYPLAFKTFSRRLFYLAITTILWER